MDSGLNESWERVFGNRGVLVVGNEFPAGSEFGLDCMAYETGSKFQGICNVPPGFHIVYHSHGSFQRQGFFIVVNEEKKLQYLPWNVTTEELEPTIHLNDATLQNLSRQILQGAFNEGLGPYCERQHSMWLNLSQFISIQVLHRASIGLNILISSGNDELQAEDMAHLESLTPSPKNSFDESEKNHSGSTLLYVDFRTFEEQYFHSLYRSLTPDVLHTEITRIKQDKSTILSSIVQEKYGGSRELLLGELQLAFVMFMMLYSFQGLDQWKNMLTFICQCGSFLQENIDFSSYFIQSLFHQLKFIPEDFFEAEISKENFLLPAFSNLISSLFETSSARLRESVQRFQKFIDKRFGLSVVKNTIESQPDESPVVDYTCISTSDEQDGANPITLSKEALQSELFQSLKDHFTGGPQLSEQQTKELVGDFDINKTFASKLEKESAKYSWRYPLLYEAMISAKGSEDLLMTAMRVLDEFENFPATDKESTVSKLRNEAISFLEKEAMSYSSNF